MERAKCRSGKTRLVHLGNGIPAAAKSFTEIGNDGGIVQNDEFGFFLPANLALHNTNYNQFHHQGNTQVTRHHFRTWHRPRYHAPHSEPQQGPQYKKYAQRFATMSDTEKSTQSFRDNTPSDHHRRGTHPQVMLQGQSPP